MNTETIRCRDLMVGDLIADNNGFRWQITNVGDDYAYATFEGNEGDPWEFNDKDDQPEGIPLTKEMLDANGFRYEEDHGPFYRSILGSYFSTSEYCNGRKHQRAERYATSTAKNGRMAGETQQPSGGSFTSTPSSMR